MVDSRINSPDIKKLASKRVLDARFRLILKRPFFGNLLLHLKFSLAKCGTAATDMRRIMFDPEFVISLTDAELDFVLMHEVMHCALQHCVRGKNKNQYFYNIACDIVVNSNILQTMGVSSFCVDGAEIIHLTPESKEGFLYSAEEVYEMLIKKYDALNRDSNDVQQNLERDYGDSFDAHDIWNLIPTNDSLSNEWKEYMSDSAKKIGTVECPPGVRELLEEFECESKLNWRIVLNDFIKARSDCYDFLFLPPDRRFSTGDFILPSFSEDQGEQINDIWFLIDTSGSITTQELSMAFNEIKVAIEQFDYLSGKLSFFDTSVSVPINFDSVEQLMDIEPVGGGGTSFHCIFKYMSKNMMESLPTAVIILTDGYAKYPQEQAALDVPVLWIIAGENELDAPWGTTIHI